MKRKSLHGEANPPYLQRADLKLKAKGVKSERRVKPEREVASMATSRSTCDISQTFLGGFDIISWFHPTFDPRY